MRFGYFPPAHTKYKKRSLLHGMSGKSFQGFQCVAVNKYKMWPGILPGQTCGKPVSSYAMQDDGRRAVSQKPRPKKKHELAVDRSLQLKRTTDHHDE